MLGVGSLVHTWGSVRFVIAGTPLTQRFGSKGKALPFGRVFRAPENSSFWLLHHQNVLLRLKGEGAPWTTGMSPSHTPFELWQLISLLPGLAAGSEKRLTSPITFFFDEFLSALKDITFGWNDQWKHGNIFPCSAFIRVQQFICAFNEIESELKIYKQKEIVGGKATGTPFIQKSITFYRLYIKKRQRWLADVWIWGPWRWRCLWKASEGRLPMNPDASTSSV